MLPPRMLVLPLRQQMAVRHMQEQDAVPIRWITDVTMCLSSFYSTASSRSSVSASSARRSSGAVRPTPQTATAAAATAGQSQQAAPSEEKAASQPTTPRGQGQLVRFDFCLSGFSRCDPMPNPGLFYSSSRPSLHWMMRKRRMCRSRRLRLRRHRLRLNPAMRLISRCCCRTTA